MKRMTGLLFALAVTGLSLPAFAQTADQIVKKHIAAIGGDSWKKVKSLKASLKMNMMGQDMTVTQLVMPGKGIRRDIEMAGQTGYAIVTPTAGWSYMPMVPGQDSVTPMPKEQLDASQADLMVGGSFYNAKANGTTITLLGKEELDGNPAFKLKLTEKSGDTSLAWIDAGTYYLVRRTEEKEMMGQKITMESTFSEYKKLPEGIVVPTTLKQVAMGMDFGSTIFENYEVNKQTDTGVFKP